MQAHRPKPICASCGQTMSDRHDKGWFCPGCAEYDRYLPAIYPNDPSHPAFYEGLEDNPTVLENRPVKLSRYGQTSSDYVGTIIDTRENYEDVVIEYDLDEPFELTVRKIPLDRFIKLLHKPGNPARPNPIPEDKELFILQ